MKILKLKIFKLTSFATSIEEKLDCLIEKNLNMIRKM